MRRCASRARSRPREDAGDHVRVEIETDGKRETLRARYVVGADGARSTVRHAMGLPFEGMTYPETTLLVTTLFPFEEHLEGISNVSYCWKENGNFSLLKVPGRWRVSIYPDENIPIDDQMTPEALDAALQIIVPRDVTYDIAEQRPYRVHMRMVPTYRQGRMLLAGDAAHLNTPAGGMGLNGGIHDAFELAAALIDVLRHGAPEARLDAYDRRRRPIAREDILAQADRNRARMRERDPARRRELLKELQATANDREKLRAFLRRSSMLEGLAKSRSDQLTRHSGLAPESFTTCPSRTMSRATIAARSCGVPGMMIEPCGSSVFLTSSLCSALTNSSFSLRTTGSGIPAGPNRPNHCSISTPGKPASVIVGRSGNCGCRCAPAIASMRSLPLSICGPAVT